MTPTDYTYYNDTNHYCCQVLKKNIENGNLPKGLVDGRDIREVDAADLMGYQHIHLFAGIGGFPLGFQWAGVPSTIKLISGGFPCQDISPSGTRTGITGERSGLWRELLRLARAVRPDYLIVENSSALALRGLDVVLGDLTSIGYDAQWQTLSAAALGAAHLRRRCVLVAYPSGIRQSQSRLFRQDAYTEQALCSTWPTNDALVSLRRGTLSTLCRGAHGLPHRMDRMSALGNSIVPQIAEYLGRCIIAHAASCQIVDEQDMEEVA